MFDVLREGAVIFFVYKESVFAFFIAVCGLGLYIIRHSVDYELNPKIRPFAVLGVGSVALCVVSYILIFLSHFWPFLLRPGSFTILFFSMFVLLRGFWLGEIKFAFDIHIAIGAIGLILLLLIRLAFLKYIILPSYSDSPIHYQIVSEFLHLETDRFSKLSLDNIVSNYYHFGFHSLSAWLASITELEPGIVISLLGQLFLVIVPVSVVFLTYVMTGNMTGAIFAGLLAAAGWEMPAFSINWGKFPALSSLAVLPSVLAILWLYWYGNTKKILSQFFGSVLLIGIALMHTRIIVCVLLFVICFLLSNKLSVGPELGIYQSVRYSVLYIISLWPVLQWLADFYKGIPGMVVLLVLLPFAFQVFPRLALGLFLFTFGLCLVTIGPTLINRNYQTLLDRQFLEMMLYIPFSIIGGAGFAGFTQKLLAPGLLQRLVFIVLFGGMVLNLLNANSVYPDSCCNYFKESDRLAFEWIQARTSEHTLVLISTFHDDGQVIGTDAGIWLLPLIGQNVNKLPFNINWSSSAEVGKICPFGAKDIYIYMGGRGSSFDNNQLAQEKWMKLVFKAGATMIYQVAECPK